MDKLEYVPKGEIAPLANEVIEELKKKELPIWQAKEILREAIRLIDWHKMK